MSSSIYTDPRFLGPNEIRVALAARARQLRIAQAMKQGELARAAGVTQATISQFESTGAASFETVVKIAIALGAERGLDELFAAPRTRSIDEIIAGAKKPRLRVR
jgi:transcriptional regulator with XRE-family HTH domain